MATVELFVNTPDHLPIPTLLQNSSHDLGKNYTLGKKLGEGQFGTTYLCTEKATGLQYACKCIPKRKLEDPEDINREVAVMFHLAGHPNIVTLKNTYEDLTSVYLVMELCEGGELFDRLVERGMFTEAEAAYLIKTIVGVVDACHKAGVVHRDLKPENFLFKTRDEDEVFLMAVDFGSARFFEPGDVFRDIVGSPYYVAPEVLDGRYGPEVDVWSAGVMLYIFLCGVPPYWAETVQGIFEEVMEARPLRFSEHPWMNVSEGAKDLIRKMMDPDPRKRLTAEEVLEHPWICGAV